MKLDRATDLRNDEIVLGIADVDLNGIILASDLIERLAQQLWDHPQAASVAATLRVSGQPFQLELRRLADGQSNDWQAS